MKDAVFWILWGVTIAICAWKLIEGFIRPRRMLEWPFLACAMWAYFYGYMAYDAKLLLSSYLPGNMAALGQTMALLCLVAVLAGWRLGLRGRVRVPAAQRAQPLLFIWALGLFFLLVGAAGGYSVMHSAETGALDYQDSSAYWYLLFYVGYPGAALAIWSVCRLRSPFRIWLIALTIFSFAAFMFPHVLNARRGPLFPGMMVLLLVPPLARRRAPNPWLFFGGLAAAALVMLLFLQIRTVTYAGGTWKQALETVDVTSAVTDRGEQAEDNEYVNSCQLIGTIYQNGKYQYGSGHLSLLFHWIPRAIWKEKPSLGEGTYSFDEMFDDVEAATGFHLLGTGASSGGVADTFVQYGVFCPIFWFLLSWLMGAVYLRAMIAGRPRWLFCYVGFICATHWLVSQGFAAAFVPGMCFQAVPFLIFLVLHSGSRNEPVRSLQPRKAGPLSPGRPAIAS
jgi:hypothetical protein